MEEQSYAKHTKLVPMFHYFLLPLTLVILIGSVYNLMGALNAHLGRRSAVVIVCISIALIITAFFARVFALKAQDRAIRAEENLRHYVLTGKLLDRRLTVRQIIGLRFASDEEFPELARRAANETLPPAEIKKSVKNWRADNDRL